MNPLYLAYCRAHEMTPEEMLAHDKVRWKGGKMCGYILWINERRVEFTKHHGAKSQKHAITSLEDIGSHLSEVRGKRVDIHEEFAAWLSVKYPMR